MKNIIIANWKLNPATLKEAKQLFDAVKKDIKKNKNVQVVICPPFVYVPCSMFHVSWLALGAQNVSSEEKGAFTGEVSVDQLKDLGVEYVIVGHSERRKYFGETNEIINKKLQRVLAVALHPIFCIGENTGEDKQEVLKQQLTEGLKNISENDVKNVVIAYEPVWAIGTGNSCSVDQLMASVVLIKNIISKLYTQEIADQVAILYGGSVTSKNSGDYLFGAGINGLLVGGASLKAEEFINIITSAN